MWPKSNVSNDLHTLNLCGCLRAEEHNSGVIFKLPTDNACLPRAREPPDYSHLNAIRASFSPDSGNPSTLARIQHVRQQLGCRPYILEPTLRGNGRSNGGRLEQASRQRSVHPVRHGQGERIPHTFESFIFSLVTVLYRGP